jgi:hypothetical protein
MKGIIIGVSEVEFDDKDREGKLTGKKVKMNKVSVLKEDLRIKEVFVKSESPKGFEPKMVVDLFSILEDQDYVEVTFNEDYTGKVKLDKIRPFVADQE